MPRPLQIGIMLPDTEREMAGSSARWADLLAMATTAEGCGFDSLWVSDHLIFRFEGKEPQGVWECWSLLSALAASTSRVAIGPLVSATSFRNPALLAKIAATVDEIAGGRLILGLGAGWHAPEYAAFGYPFDHRVSRFEEALTIVRGLLRDGHVDFDGTYYQARDCELRPRGPRPSGPPLMIGSTSPRMLSLCARHADLWNGWGKNDPAAIPPVREIVDAACREVGRQPASLARTVSVLIDLPGAAGRPREQPPFLTGSTAELAETFRGFAREGISHIQVVLDPNSVTGIERLAPVLELLDRG
ncbi:MAG: LLM class flavin-dependent oxidoreductase [Chloroflexia bacterium]|nr:LLM class flavin-dependent oxidoreductase [Chloroflexia bacterium]